MNLVSKFNLLQGESTMYYVQYEKTLPPWYIGTDKVEAETSEDAVKEFYKRHDSFEDRVKSVYEMQNTYQKNVM